VATQDDIALATVRLAMRGTVWLLHRREALRDVDASIKRWSPGVAEVAAGLERWLAPHERAGLDADAARLAGLGVPADLAQRVARLDASFSALDIVEVSLDTARGRHGGRRLLRRRRAAGPRLGVAADRALTADSHWQGLARVALRDDLSALAGSLARSVLQSASARPGAEALDRRVGGAARVPAAPLPRAARRPQAGERARHGDAVGAAARAARTDMTTPSAFGAPPQGGAAGGPAEPDPRRLLDRCRASDVMPQLKPDPRRLLDRCRASDVMPQLKPDPRRLLDRCRASDVMRS
jgi:hypothetical protein